MNTEKHTCMFVCVASLPPLFLPHLVGSRPPSRPNRNWQQQQQQNENTGTPNPAAAHRHI